MGRQPEGTFVAAEPLSLWAASGEYTLQKVEVSDREWNSTLYERGNATQFDFAAADFRVNNPLEDAVTPTCPSDGKCALSPGEACVSSVSVSCVVKRFAEGVSFVELYWTGPLRK